MKRITLFSTVGTIVIICFIIITLSGNDCDECFSAPVMAVKFFISGLVIIIGSIYFTRLFLRIENIIFDIESQPLLETEEAASEVPFAGEGVVESEGEKILTSPYTKTPCVYFHSIKEIYVKRDKGSNWKIIENIALFVPFYIKDKKGRLKIDLTNLDDDFSGYKILLQTKEIPNPANSEIDCEPVLRHQQYNEEKTGFRRFSTTKKYRRSEFILRPGTKVFVYGIVSKRNGELVLHEDKRCPLIISKKNRDQYVEEFYQGGGLVYLVHLLATIGYTVALFSVNYFLKIDFIKLLNILFIGNTIIAGSAIFSIYNRIITLRHRTLNSLSNIDIEVKRRADLVPNLVEVIKGYTKHEKEIQQIIAESRAKTVFLKELPEETKPVIPSLVAVIENYPDLKASEQFQYLMRALVDTEERIIYSREFYNRSVRKYNILIKQFPFILISAFLDMKEMDFISISRGEGEVFW
jgi:LemA protein